MASNPPDAHPLFRKNAIERLSSPDQLDLVMHVTSPRTWVALTALAILIAAAIVWGFIGSIPTRVTASGILIRPGGIFDVFVRQPGPITQVLVAEGDMVKAGQVVARVDQPELSQQIASQRTQVAELEQQDAALSAVATEDQSLRDDTRALRQSQLNDTINFNKERITALQDQLANEEQLLEKGLLTRQTLLQTRQALFAAQDLVQQSQSQLRQLPLDRLTTQSSSEQARVTRRLHINELKRSIGELQRQLDEASTVITPYSGRVVEVKLDRGALARQGASLLAIEVAGANEGLQAIVYVPPASGKQVLDGMEVQVSPTTIQREEFGFMIGKVTYVSEFPATNDGMMRVLSNPGLVQSLSSQGPPFAVYADLESNPAARDGYRWSSPKGEALSVNSGTLCDVTITVRERKPIELVIPTLRSYLGL